MESMLYIQNITDRVSCQAYFPYSIKNSSAL